MRPKISPNGLFKTLLCFVMIAGFLPKISGQDDKKSALDLVQSNLGDLALSKADVDNLYVTDAHVDRLSGALVVYLQQQYKSINVHNALYSIAFKDGKVVSASNGFVQRIQTKVNSEVPAVSPDAALMASAKHLNIQAASSVRSSRVIEQGKYLEFDKSNISQKNIPVKLVWVVVDASTVRLAWEVHIDPVNAPDMWNVRIDASKGVVLDKDNWNRQCRWENFADGAPVIPIKRNRSWVTPLTGASSPASASSAWSASAIPLTQSSNYVVIPYPYESPLYTNGLQTLHANPWLLAGNNNPATSYGWHYDGTADYAYTRGNNVFALEDINQNNNPVGYVASSTTSFPALNFQYPYDFTKQPGISGNVKSALTNLFYWNNIMHDISYQYGFDEASGNFQKDNLGRGGLGNDFVYADAQDGGGFSNANFAIPPDGENARMQMYLFDPVIDFKVNAPSSIAGDIDFVEIGLSPKALLRDVGSITGNIVVYNDNPAGSSHQACSPGYNPQMNGNIALIDFGTCPYSTKVKNAQNQGAIAVIIIFSEAGPGGFVDTTVTIPTIQVSQADGIKLKNEYLKNITVNVTIAVGVNVDGDLDNGVIAHEYAHGISTRLTGGRGAASCLPIGGELMGEGWSDYYALMVTTDWSKAQLSDGSKRRPIGNYVLNQTASGSGIRSYPYSTDMTVNPLTYSAVAATGGEEHYVGEVWCAVLWDLTWAIINADGAINANLFNPNGNGGNSVAMKLVTFGLKLQPCQPGFLDGRNAILRADSILFNGKYSCTIWKAFARRGMGSNASQGSSLSYLDQVQGFNIPDRATIRKSVDRFTANTGDFINYSLAVECQCAALTGLTIRDTLPGNVIYQSGGTLNGREVSFSSINLPEQQKAFFNVSVQVNERFSAPINYVNEPVISPAINPAAWTRTSLLGPSQWTTSTKVRGEFSNVDVLTLYSFFAPDSARSTDFTLTSANSYPIPTGRITSLSFWHAYDAEPSWDGGVVELSTDTGRTWIDAGPYMKENGYPSAIYPGSGTGIAGRRAFTGTTGTSFIQTIIDLSSFAGRTVRFRFRFVSDVILGSTGWYVDDILLRSESGVVNNAYLYLNNTIFSRSSATTLLSNQAPLRMSFDNFDAVRENENGLITWLTSNDFNSRLYLVEKSLDGVNFHNIGTVLAAGGGATRNNYQFTDTQLSAGTNYYRLKQVDLDGKATYTDIKMINGLATIVAVSVTPNPSPGLVTISLPPSNSKIPLSVFDSKGRLVLKNALNAGNQKLDLSRLTKGVYMLQFGLKDNIVTRKIVLQ